MDEATTSRLADYVAEVTNAERAQCVDSLQELWSGYGKILRYRLFGSKYSQVIVKWICPPVTQHHPRGWNTNTSQLRKLKSYEVETHWYANWASRCDEHCRVPSFIASRLEGSETIIVLEDLDAAGFDLRLNTLSKTRLDACISWLAAFHAQFLQQKPEGLWPTGSYWHLATRQDELEKMPEGALKDQAHAIDLALSDASFQTVIHGDAKIANFCFSENVSNVAALDFQYVGGGVGIKDLSYSLGSCLASDQLFELHDWCLDTYFARLREYVGSDLTSGEFKALETEWRALYPVAVADFARFLQGWQPGHWKLNPYTQALTEQALGLT